MKFVEIYNRIIPHWGNKIDFSDGVISQPEQKMLETSGEEYFYSNTFSIQWNTIDDIIGENNTYEDLMVWTMYQVFHRHAKQLFYENIFTLNPKEISETEIEEQYYNNLQAEGWEVELDTYERLHN